MAESDPVQIWEYAVTNKPTTKGFTAWMNNMGSRGWELVQVVDLEAWGQQGHFRMFWKRPWRGTTVEINEKG